MEVTEASRAKQIQARIDLNNYATRQRAKSLSHPFRMILV